MFANSVKENHANKYQMLGALLLLTAAAFVVQGYHPCAEDAEIYIPGVEKILHPELFPAWSEFFQAHAHLTFYPNLIAFSVRLTHLSLPIALFVWQVASIFLILLACWELGRLFFPTARARWGGVCLVAALLTIPVAGTALYVMDQYLNPRNLAAFAAVFAVVRMLEKKYVRVLLWLLFAALVHPLMWAFPFSFCVLVFVMEKFESRWKETCATLAALLVFPGIPLALPSHAYRAVAKVHGYFYIQHWAWYEVLGAVAPLALFCWFAREARRQGWFVLERVSRAFVIYDLIFLAAALIVDLPAGLEVLARLQPMRCLHLLYIVLFVVIGGFAGEYILRGRIWRWLLLFVPLGAGMFLAQRSLFPSSAHIQWPGSTPRNPWAQAFVWIRENTPTDARFALDPEYMHLAGEDEMGFRCVAKRSRLADWVKDNGVVSMFPTLAGEWWEQVQEQTPWKNFALQDMLRLKRQYGVNWVVLQQPGIAGLDCQYQNSAVRVCRIP
ncbi:MAG TPA: hypothetical protein VMF10_08160 [Candidatus Aquilonibacter sp.]|nr:hypothetical protein [Candidatus Aquilonibacter sp.]